MRRVIAAAMVLLAAAAARADVTLPRIFTDHNEEVAGWAPSTPEAVAPITALRREKFADRSAGGFAEVGYVFGKKIHDELKVPVGLIKAAFGGSQVHAWTPNSKPAEESSDGSKDGRQFAYRPAQARIVGTDTVEVTCEDIQEPKYVRFGWHPLALLSSN